MYLLSDQITPRFNAFGDGFKRQYPMLKNTFEVIWLYGHRNQSFTLQLAPHRVGY